MAEASIARTLILEELQKLKNRRSNALDQGLTAKDVPLTLEQGISLWEAMLVRVTYADHHVHDVEVNKNLRETRPPR